MKKIVSNIYFQIIIGLITGAVGTVNFFKLSLASFIKYAGFDSRGDRSPITFTVFIVSLVLTFIFPILIWIFLKKYSAFRSVTKAARIFLLILFASTPFLLYLGLSFIETIRPW